MDLLGWITTLLTVGFFISGVYDEPLAIPVAHVPIRLPLRRVRKSRSVGDLSFYPFAATYVNCMLWLRYGLAIRDAPVVLVNGFGAAVACLTMIAYYIYSSDRADVERKTLQMLLLIFLIFMAMRLGWMTSAAMGFVGAITSVAMFAAPLIALRSIIRKHDSSVLALPTICMSLAVSSMWALYGIGRRDPFIAVPNVLGAGLSLLQGLIFFKYRGHGPRHLSKDRASYDHLEASLPP